MQRILNLPPVPPGTDFNELDYIRSLIDDYDPDSHTCQGCGRSSWFGGEILYYTRGITWPCNGHPKDDAIRIPCMLCSHCLAAGRSAGETGYHHAIFRGTILPFSNYTLLFILTVLQEYFTRTTTVRGVCEKWGISAKTLYAWKRRYMEHYNAWVETACSDETPDSHTCSGQTIQISATEAMRGSASTFWAVLPFLAATFFQTFGFSFMQPNKKRHMQKLSDHQGPVFPP